MIDDRQDAVDQIKGYYDTTKELKEAIESGDVHDTLHEIADSNCDVYNYDLLEWVKDNYHYVEDAISEWLNDKTSKLDKECKKTDVCEEKLILMDQLLYIQKQIDRWLVCER